MKKILSIITITLLTVCMLSCSSKSGKRIIVPTLSLEDSINIMNNKMAMLYPKSYYSPDTLEFTSVLLADETDYILQRSGNQYIIVSNDTLMQAICNQLRLRSITYTIHKQQFSHPELGDWYEWNISYRSLYLPLINHQDYTENTKTANRD